MCVFAVKRPQTKQLYVWSDDIAEQFFSSCVLYKFFNQLFKFKNDFRMNFSFKH